MADRDAGQVEHQLRERHAVAVLRLPPSCAWHHAGVGVTSGRWSIVLAVAALLAAVGCRDGAEDFDGDGSTDAADCAPEDPTIHPGADGAA